MAGQRVLRRVFGGESSRSSERASRTVLRSHGVFVERVAWWTECRGVAWWTKSRRSRVVGGGEGPNPERHGPATRARAGTSPVPHAGGTRGAVAQRDDAPQGSRDSLFLFLGFCVNDCGRRLVRRSKTVISVAVCRVSSEYFFCCTVFCLHCK